MTNRKQPSSLREFTLNTCVAFQRRAAQSARQATECLASDDLDYAILQQRNAAAYHREVAYRLDNLIGVLAP